MTILVRKIIRTDSAAIAAKLAERNLESRLNGLRPYRGTEAFRAVLGRWDIASVEADSLAAKLLDSIEWRQYVNNTRFGVAELLDLINLEHDLAVVVETDNSKLCFVASSINLAVCRELQPVVAREAERVIEIPQFGLSVAVGINVPPAEKDVLPIFYPDLIPRERNICSILSRPADETTTLVEILSAPRIEDPSKFIVRGLIEWLKLSTLGLEQRLSFNDAYRQLADILYDDSYIKGDLWAQNVTYLAAMHAANLALIFYETELP